MSHTTFVLTGNTPALSLQELMTVVKRLQPQLVVSEVMQGLLKVVGPEPLTDSTFLILGGSVKLLTLVANIPQADLVAGLAKILQTGSIGRFALSSLDVPSQGQFLSAQVKKKAKALGFATGFRPLASPLSSAGFSDQTAEFILFNSPDGTVTVLQTICVQDLATWTAKDYLRPEVDPKAGMLPPKVARMLLNLALPLPFTVKTLIYDPFCGVGTILVEALDLGLSGFGSDLNETAVTKAKSNLDWFKNSRGTPGTMTVFPHNILTPVKEILPESLDAVVFEGFLGPSKLTPDKIEDYRKGLTKFYLGAFKHLHPLLKSNGRLVGCLPAYVTSNRVKTLSRLIDSCEKLGYTQITPPQWYYRPQAQIRRQIIIWQKSHQLVK